MPKLLIAAAYVAGLAAVGVLIGSFPIAFLPRALQRRTGWSGRGALRCANVIWVAAASLLLGTGAVLLLVSSEPGSGVGLYFMLLPAWFAIGLCPLLGSRPAFEYLTRKQQRRE